MSGGAEINLELWLCKYPELEIKNTVVYLWEAGSSNAVHYSLLEYIEEHADELRRKYLAFIYGLGEYRLSGKRVVEHFQTKAGYNLWWMSLLAGKNRLNSPRITDCIKLLVVEKILKEVQPQNVIIYGDDIDVVKSVTTLCHNLGFNVQHKSIAATDRNESLWLSLRNKRPEILSAFLWLLRYIKSHRSFTKSNFKNWFDGESSIILFSKFFNFDEGKSRSNIFYSRYWETLPAFLRKNELRINWLHLFRKGPLVSDVDAGIKSIESFNTNTSDTHAFFESYLCPRVILKACGQYIRLFFCSLFWPNMEKAFQPSGSAINFWPLLKKDWNASATGAVALSNLIFIELTDIAISSMPKQKLGLYIQENHFWERALIHAWRLHGHGRLIGVSPTTVNFWDLIYFDDVRTVISNDECSQKQPDFIALNGDVAMRHFLDADYPESRLMKVEALRYLHLLVGDNNAVHVNNLLETRGSNKNNICNIIILGDYVEELTLDMLETIKKVFDSSVSIKFTFKAHPACTINIKKLHMPNLNVTKQSVSEILNNYDYDLAIMTGSTSTAIEAYLSGILTIVCLGKNELNVSCVRGLADIQFIRTPYELSLAFDYLNKLEAPVQDWEYFWLDHNLSRWRDLLLNSGYMSFSQDVGVSHK